MESRLKALRLECVNEGSHSFTCHAHVYPQVDSAVPAFTPNRRASQHNSTLLTHLQLKQLNCLIHSNVMPLSISMKS